MLAVPSPCEARFQEHTVRVWCKIDWQVQPVMSLFLWLFIRTLAAWPRQLYAIMRDLMFRNELSRISQLIHVSQTMQSLLSLGLPQLISHKLYFAGILLNFNLIFDLINLIYNRIEATRRSYLGDGLKNRFIIGRVSFGAPHCDGRQAWVLLPSHMFIVSQRHLARIGVLVPAAAEFHSITPHYNTVFGLENFT